MVMCVDRIGGRVGTHDRAAVWGVKKRKKEVAKRRGERRVEVHEKKEPRELDCSD